MAYVRFIVKLQGCFHTKRDLKIAQITLYANFALRKMKWKNVSIIKGILDKDSSVAREIAKFWTGATFSKP